MIGNTDGHHLTSPLLCSTHFIDTIKGIDTFRAYGWVPHSVIQSDTLLDTSQRPAYLLAMILAIVVVAFLTQLKKSSTGSGLTGTSLVTLMTFASTLTNFIRSRKDHGGGVSSGSGDFWRRIVVVGREQGRSRGSDEP